MEKHIKGSKKHLTSFERFKILKYLSLGYEIPKIAMFLGYNKTSIYREIIVNSTVENNKNSTAYIGGNKLKNCKNCQKCAEKGVTKCPSPCLKFLAKTCSLITKPYQVCNFCERKDGCNYQRLIYHPEIAQDLSNARFKNGKTKIKLNDDQLQRFDSYVSKLIINGQSPEVIKSYSNSEEFPVCTKTLRSYIDKCLLTARNIDLRRKMSLKLSKNYNYPRTYSHDPLKKVGHLYDDYLEYVRLHPNSVTFQCDTVYGRRNDKKCLLTIHADELHFQMYILLANKTAWRVNNEFLKLRKVLGEEKYSELFQVLLSDNGLEFDNILDLEANNDGVVLSRIFYTRPYRSSDKAECERNHELFRYIRNKGKTLETLDENDVFEVNSHINSYPRKSLKWKTPIEAMKVKYGEDIIDKLGIKEIKRKDVILTAKLLSK